MNRNVRSRLIWAATAVAVSGCQSMPVAYGSEEVVRQVADAVREAEVLRLNLNKSSSSLASPDQSVQIEVDAVLGHGLKNVVFYRASNSMIDPAPVYFAGVSDRGEMFRIGGFPERVGEFARMAREILGVNGNSSATARSLADAYFSFVEQWNLAERPGRSALEKASATKCAGVRRVLDRDEGESYRLAYLLRDRSQVECIEVHIDLREGLRVVSREVVSGTGRVEL